MKTKVILFLLVFLLSSCGDKVVLRDDKIVYPEDYCFKLEGNVLIGYDFYCQKDIVIPPEIKGVQITEIGEGALSGYQFTSAVIPGSVKIIGNNAFYDNVIESVVIPSSVTTIGENAFSKNKITTLNLPNSVKKIGAGAFSYNELNNVVISKKIKKLEEGAFTNNKLTDVVIPGGIKKIPNNVFDELVTIKRGGVY